MRCRAVMARDVAVTRLISAATATAVYALGPTGRRRVNLTFSDAVTLADPSRRGNSSLMTIGWPAHRTSRRGHCTFHLVPERARPPAQRLAAEAIHPEPRRSRRSTG